MKMLDINNNLINADVRQTSYPVKAVSKSKLQGKVGEYLQEHFPLSTILEDFVLPGSKLSVDFFVIQQRIVVEIQSDLHDMRVPFFHGDRNHCNYAKQISHDLKKQQWAINNGYKFVEIRSEEDMKQI